MTPGKTVVLADGTVMPSIGLGVWMMAEGPETENAVASALELGYRHIDTAKFYGNERSVGNAIRNSSIPRDEIFVTTKLWPTNFLNPEVGFNESFEKLDLGYIDLYLVHWPAPVMPKKVWRTLENLYEQGFARSIGVSNHSVHHIEKLLTYANVAPMVNQVKFNPMSHDFELLEYCKSKKIVVEAYSPLGRGNLIRNKTVNEIAARCGKSPAQVLVRWAIEHSTVPLPKSSHPHRIKENLEVFDFNLSVADLATLNCLNRT